MGRRRGKREERCFSRMAFELSLAGLDSPCPHFSPPRFPPGTALAFVFCEPSSLFVLSVCVLKKESTLRWMATLLS